MAEGLNLLKQLLFQNWQRKLIALMLSMTIWIALHHSITTTKVINGVPVRVVHVPPGKTVEGMLGSGILSKKINLHVSGNKAALEELSAKNLEVVIDADGQPDEWIASIGKKNLHCSNSDINVHQAIAKVSSLEMIIKQTRLVSDKIPVLITHPTGEAPKGYQLLDIWPSQLLLSVSGPEEVVKKLKAKGAKLTFHLNDIAKTELDALQSKKETDELSFLVPAQWKKVFLPQLSDQPLEIDDPQAKFLRIDFSRQDFLPVDTQLPITVFFPSKYTHTLNPDTYSISTNECVVKKNGIKTLAIPLYAQGVSRLFLDIVKERIQIAIIAEPKSERDALLWSVDFIYPHELENRYVAKMLAELRDEDGLDVLPHLREDYLRNRFRRYMNRFRFYTENHEKLNLKIELQANTISVNPLHLPVGNKL